jgi:hypothetical protein
MDVRDEGGLRQLAAKLAGLDKTLFARVAIKADEAPRFLPVRDGVALKLRFRRAMGVGEAII